MLVSPVTTEDDQRMVETCLVFVLFLFLMLVSPVTTEDDQRMVETCLVFY